MAKPDNAFGYDPEEYDAEEYDAEEPLKFPQLPQRDFRDYPSEPRAPYDPASQMMALPNDPAVSNLVEDVSESLKGLGDGSLGELWNDIKQAPWAEAGQDLVRDAKQALGSFAPGAPPPGAQPKPAMPDMYGALANALQALGSFAPGAPPPGAQPKPAMPDMYGALASDIQSLASGIQSLASPAQTTTPTAAETPLPVAQPKPEPPHTAFAPSAAKAVPEYLKNFAAGDPQYSKDFLQAFQKIDEAHRNLSDFPAINEGFSTAAAKALKHSGERVASAKKVTKLLSSPKTFADGQAKAMEIAHKYNDPIINDMLGAGNYQGIDARVKYLASVHDNAEHGVAAQEYQNKLSARVAKQIGMLYQGKNARGVDQNNSASAWFKTLSPDQKFQVWNSTVQSVQAEMQRETAALDQGDYNTYLRGGMSTDDLRINQLMRRDNLDHKAAAQKWTEAKLEAEFMQKSNKTPAEMQTALAVNAGKPLADALRDQLAKAPTTVAGLRMAAVKEFDDENPADKFPNEDSRGAARNLFLDSKGAKVPAAELNASRKLVELNQDGKAHTLEEASLALLRDKAEGKPLKPEIVYKLNNTINTSGNAIAALTDVRKLIESSRLTTGVPRALGSYTAQNLGRLIGLSDEKSIGELEQNLNILKLELPKILSVSNASIHDKKIIEGMLSTVGLGHDRTAVLNNFDQVARSILAIHDGALDQAAADPSSFRTSAYSSDIQGIHDKAKQAVKAQGTVPIEITRDKFGSLEKGTRFRLSGDPAGTWRIK